MSLERISYRNLPLAVRNRIEDVTGVVLSDASVGDGLNSSVAALLHTRDGRYFVKALPVDHRWVWTQEREAEIAQHVRPVSPALCARIADHGWDVLVFEALEGRQADYAPGSADLPHVVDLLTRMGELACPATILRQAEQRLQAYTDASELHHFTGDALLHTDLNNANVIVGDGRARIVDWGWATRGAPWLDAAYWVIWLMAAGHKAQSAEQWAAKVPAWHTAPANGITAFAAANTRMWVKAGGKSPDEWTRRLIIAADTWHEFRTVPIGG
ncbi:MAG TPA: hypothetical protein VF657_17590 [Actinoplanes sp.]